MITELAQMKTFAFKVLQLDCAAFIFPNQNLTPLWI